MEWIKNLKVNQKLTLLIAMSAFFLLVVGLVGYGFENKSSKDMASLYNARVLPISWFGQIKDNINDIRNNIFQMGTTSDYNRKKDLAAEIVKDRNSNDELWAKYEKTKLDSFESENLAKYKKLLSEYRPNQKKAMDMAMANKNQQSLVFFSSIQPQADEIMAVAAALADIM